MVEGVYVFGERKDLELEVALRHRGRGVAGRPLGEEVQSVRAFLWLIVDFKSGFSMGSVSLRTWERGELAHNVGPVMADM